MDRTAARLRPAAAPHPHHARRGRAADRTDRRRLPLRPSRRQGPAQRAHRGAPEPRTRLDLRRPGPGTARDAGTGQAARRRPRRPADAGRPGPRHPYLPAQRDRQGPGQARDAPAEHRPRRPLPAGAQPPHRRGRIRTGRPGARPAVAAHPAVAVRGVRRPGRRFPGRGTDDRQQRAHRRLAVGRRPGVGALRSTPRTAGRPCRGRARPRRRATACRGRRRTAAHVRRRRSARSGPHGTGSPPAPGRPARHEPGRAARRPDAGRGVGDGGAGRGHLRQRTGPEGRRGGRPVAELVGRTARRARAGLLRPAPVRVRRRGVHRRDGAARPGVPGRRAGLVQPGRAPRPRQRGGTPGAGRPVQRGRPAVDRALRRAAGRPVLGDGGRASRPRGGGRVHPRHRPTAADLVRDGLRQRLVPGAAGGAHRVADRPGPAPGTRRLRPPSPGPPRGPGRPGLVDVHPGQSGPGPSGGVRAADAAHRTRSGGAAAGARGAGPRRTRQPGMGGSAPLHRRPGGARRPPGPLGTQRTGRADRAGRAARVRGADHRAGLLVPARPGGGPHGRDPLPAGRPHRSRPRLTSRRPPDHAPAVGARGGGAARRRLRHPPPGAGPLVRRFLAQLGTPGEGPRHGGELERARLRHGACLFVYKRQSVHPGPAARCRGGPGRAVRAASSPRG